MTGQIDSDGWIYDVQRGDRLMLHDIRALVLHIPADRAWVGLMLFWDNEGWLERRALPIGPNAQQVSRTHDDTWSREQAMIWLQAGRVRTP